MSVVHLCNILNTTHFSVIASVHEAIPISSCAKRVIFALTEEGVNVNKHLSCYSNRQRCCVKWNVDYLLRYIYIYINIYDVSVFFFLEQ